MQICPRMTGRPTSQDEQNKGAGRLLDRRPCF